ncbi:MAG: radical SAM protein, partial [Nanoarchaeota archaeon]|nr:radical SAM protein [Nanoarchaeota archaeon]
MNCSRETQALIDWTEGKSGKPYRIQLEPTYKCNLKCVYCSRHNQTFDYESELPTEKWIEIVRDAAEIGFKSVILSGEGDVIATPERTFEMIKEIKKQGMEGSMITNATLFNPDMIEDIVRIGWDDMVISVDAPDKSHDDLAGVKGSFEKVYRNLKLFKYWKDKLGKEKPDICFITVVTNKNYKKFGEIMELAHEV